MFKKSEFVYVLRTCSADMTSQYNFKYPVKGFVKAPDWQPTYECGHGLHGLLWGAGKAGYLDLSDTAKWLILKVNTKDLLHGQGDLTDKCKFRCGTVVHVGDRISANRFLQSVDKSYDIRGVVFGNATAGYKGTAIAGSYGTANAGHYGTAIAGDYGTANAGYYGTATAGHYGTATVGDNGIATAGYYGTATAGDYGTATDGDGGTANAGNGGTATAGDGGTATAGDYGTATAGNNGTATAGEDGTIVILSWDENNNRYRRNVGYIGENGLKANTAYQWDNNKKKFIEKE